MHPYFGLDGLMHIAKLFQQAGLSDMGWDFEVTGVSVDSRLVKKGELFLALNGSVKSGSEFADEAIMQGAIAVLSEEVLIDINPNIAWKKIEGLRNWVAPLFNSWFENPGQGLLSIAVTGTNGKSTITRLCASVLEGLGKKVMALGTIQYQIGNEILNAPWTTPAPEAFFPLLRRGVDQGCNALVMEVSSHALDQDRLRSFHFQRAIFTNLTQDHFDYHKGFEDYYQAKKKLFSEYLLDDGIAILNLDSSYGRRLALEIKNPRLGFSRQKSAQQGLTPDIYLEHSEMQLSGTQLTLNFQGKSYSFTSKLVGELNLENLLATIALGFSLDIPAEELARSIANVTVHGRNEVFALPMGAYAIVDYAHTPDALERVLLSLRPLTPGRIFCLFGCGGDRDKTKRPQMGALAEKCADKVFLTSDNPRTENAESILQEILSGMIHKDDVTVESDRRAAIRLALQGLQRGDCLVIAGKGHEEYQVIGREKKPFSDQREVLDFMQVGKN